MVESVTPPAKAEMVSPLGGIGTNSWYRKFYINDEHESEVDEAIIT